MRGIGNILVGIVFIIGGATGKLALIGTNSSVAIMILGVALVAWGGWQAFLGMKMGCGGGARGHADRIQSFAIRAAQTEVFAAFG